MSPTVTPRKAKFAIIFTYNWPLVDFGYKLGRDTEPNAPPIKVCKETVDEMGGNQNARFKSFRFATFTMSANLIQSHHTHGAYEYTPHQTSRCS